MPDTAERESQSRDLMLCMRPSSRARAHQSSPDLTRAHQSSAPWSGWQHATTVGHEAARRSFSWVIDSGLVWGSCGALAGRCATPSEKHRDANKPERAKDQTDDRAPPTGAQLASPERSMQPHAAGKHPDDWRRDETTCGERPKPVWKRRPITNLHGEGGDEIADGPQERADQAEDHGAVVVGRCGSLYPAARWKSMQH